MVSNQTLLKIASIGGVIVAATGFHLQNRIIDKIRNNDYYRDALKILRTHAGAVYLLGEPIKDKRFKLSDSENNFSDGHKAKFTIPVSGPKSRATYYFWAERKDNQWTITRAELQLKNEPDKRLAIVKVSESTDLS